MGASTRFKHTTCYAYFNDEYRSCLYSLIQLGVIYATQIFFNNPYVSNLGAHGSSYYCKCLTVITYKFQPIVYEMSAHSINFTWNYASILIPYYVSLGASTNSKITSTISIDLMFRNPILSTELGNFYSSYALSHIIAKRYVSLGAYANLKHFANWTSSLEKATFSIRVTYEVIGHIEPAPLVYRYYVSLGAHSVLEHYANWTSSLAIEKYSFRISYQVSGHIDYGFQLSIRHVSLGATLWLLTSSKRSKDIIIYYQGDYYLRLVYLNIQNLCSFA